MDEIRVPAPLEPTPGGYRELLVVAIPLILSTASWSIQNIVDRIFLTWFDPSATAAALPAGILNFTIMSIFIGTAGYAETFVAQYFGAGMLRRIGPALWQGVYVALIGAALHLALIPAAPAIFRLAGHTPAVQAFEVPYFRMLCLGAGPAIAAAALGGFYAGLGRTRPVMWINFAATGVNIFLDWVLIFGHLGAPRLGITGAGIATAVSAYVACSCYIVIFFMPAHEKDYATRSGWRFDRELFRRLLRFGLPSGLHFFLDVAGFTFFMLMIGRLGEDVLAAASIAFNINSLAFMPMLGLGIAVSILVGQYLGRNDPATAARSTYTGLKISLVYMIGMAALYLFIPRLFLKPYILRIEDPAAFAATAHTVVVLLRFVAIYSILDAFNIIFASALKGAGDTRFIMIMLAVFSFGGLVLPTWLVLNVFGGGLNAAFWVITIYINLLALAFLARFLQGKWKSMRVIEETVPVILPAGPEGPGSALGVR